MTSAPTEFWTWFPGFANRLPEGTPPEEMLDELLDQIHAFDDRIYFEFSANTTCKELIFTAQGVLDAFPAVEVLVNAAPQIDGWSFVALKPSMGFDFTHSDNGIVLNAAELWFLPLKSAADPSALGLKLALPNADAVFERQTVDTAFTILESGIGERACAVEIQHVIVTDLPDDPASHLPEFLASRRSQKPSA